MAEDRPEGFVDAVENPLCLAEGIAEQHAGLAGGNIGRPPLIDLGEDLRLWLPAIDRQAEGRFGDKRVAAHRFEWGAGAIRLDLVIARCDPDFAAVFQAHLR